MGWVWDWDTEVAVPTVISLLNQMVSVTLSKLPQRTLHRKLCDIVVIPFQEETAETKPQSIISRPFFTPHTVWLFSSHMGISKWTSQCCGEVTGSWG